MNTIHGSHSHSMLEFRGNFHLQGPQPVGTKGGVPQWVADYFVENPDVDTIALSGKKSGIVWNRMDK